MKKLTLVILATIILTSCERLAYGHTIQMMEDQQNLLKITESR